MSTPTEVNASKPLMGRCHGCFDSGLWDDVFGDYLCAQCATNIKPFNEAEGHLDALLEPVIAAWFEHYAKRMGRRSAAQCLSERLADLGYKLADRYKAQYVSSNDEPLRRTA